MATGLEGNKIIFIESFVSQYLPRASKLKARIWQVQKSFACNQPYFGKDLSELVSFMATYLLSVDLLTLNMP